MPAPLSHDAATIADWIASDHPQIHQFAGLDHYFAGSKDAVLAVLEAPPIKELSGDGANRGEAVSRSNPDGSAPEEALTTLKGAPARQLPSTPSIHADGHSDDACEFRAWLAGL